MDIDFNLKFPAQSNAFYVPTKTQAEIDALTPTLSVWQKQYLRTFNDGAVKHQPLFPAHWFYDNPNIRFLTFQNKYGCDYTDVSTTYLQPSPQEWVPYTVELDGNGKVIPSYFYNDNSGVYLYYPDWSLSFMKVLHKHTGVPQYCAGVMVGASGFNNNAQNWKVSTVSKPGDNLYQRGIEVIQYIKSWAATNGHTIRTIRILQEQGEANNTTAVSTYKADLKAALDGWIAEIGTSVNVIIRKTGLDADGSNNAGTAQQELASENSYIYCWDDYTFPSDEYGGDFSKQDHRAKYPRQFGDVYHITPLGQDRIGVDMGIWSIANVTGL